MNEPARRILIVEDDQHLAQRLGDGLTEAGYAVVKASSAREARHVLARTPPALVLLDLGLPDADGMDILRDVRVLHPDLPVIITTARDGITDRVGGLEIGADDYMVKPYSFEELLARIRTQLRHYTRAQLRRTVGNLEIDFKTRSVNQAGSMLELTPREFDLLAFLVSLNGEVASRDRIQKEVWKVRSRMTSMDNVIDVHIARLRKKLTPGPEAPFLRTVRGVGIVIEGPA